MVITLSRTLKSGVLLVVAYLSFSCGPSHVPVSYVYQRCPMFTPADPRAHSFGAMLGALDSRGWIVEEFDFKAGKIRAHACLQNDPGNCVSLVFTMMPSGTVEAKSPRDALCRNNLRDDIERWTNLLEKEWTKHRCYDEKTINVLLSKYGLGD